MRDVTTGGKPAKLDNMGYGNKVVDLQTEEDFSPEASAKRETIQDLAFSDTRRELQRKIERVEADPIRQNTDKYGMRLPAGTVAKHYRDQVDALLERDRKRRNIPNFDSLKPVKDIIDTARSQGVELTADQIRDLTDFGVVNSAADQMIASMKAGYEPGVRNVLLTLDKTNPVMAAIVPAVVEAKLQEAAEDPNLITNIVSGVTEAAAWAFGPLVAANNWMMEGVRAGEYRLGENFDPNATYNANIVPFAQGFLSADDRAAVAEGNLNQSYIEEIMASGEYSPLQVQIAADVASAAASGDPDAIINVWQDKYFGNEEAAPIFRDIMFSKMDSNMPELLRQIDSAHLGNTGQVIFGAADNNAVFDPARGGDTRQDLANVAGFATSMVLDPTLALGRFGKLYMATRWGLARLAPGVSASEVLTQGRLGRLSVGNPAYRYFDTFAKSLNDLDDLEKQAAKAVDQAEKIRLDTDAASLRQRMSRHFDEMPEDLIEDFRTSTWRTPDGKFTVETLAAAIDEMNETFVTASGEVTERLAVQGATRNALMEALIKIKTDPNATAKQIWAATDELNDAKNAVKRLQTERAGMKDVAGRIASKNQKRTALVPRMSMIAQARVSAVNELAYMMMPQEKAARLVDEFLTSSGDVAVFAQALSDNAVEFGQETRKLKFSPSGFGDSLGRMFSSVAVNRTVDITSGSDAREVYRYARSFFPKRTSEMLADAYRRGDESSRRLLLSGLVRSAAASRGLVMSADDAGKIVLRPKAEQLMTGSMKGEQYGVTIADGLLPSQRAAGLGSPTPGMSRSLSADEAGIEHAIHLSQTANQVALPSIRDFEQLRNGMRVKIGNGAERVTNMWSLGTLFGLRFSMRNAIEEVGMYWLLGGSMTDFVRGRRLDQAIRAARPRLIVEQGENGPEVALRTSLGMVANKAEWTSRWLRQRGYPEWMAEMVFRQADPESLKAAGVALAKGDTEAFSKLAVQSLAKQRVFGFRTNLGNEETELAFRYLVESSHGMALLDEISEAGTYLQSGGFPAYVDAMYGIDDAVAGVEFGKINPVKYGAYGNTLPVAASEGDEIYGLGFWWRELQTTLDGDGPIGEAAVRGLTNPEAAKKEIAAIIRADKDFGYKEKFSRIGDDASIDSFADSYFENVFQHFTKQDGTLNLALRDQFFDPATGKYSWWKQGTEEGTSRAAVSRADLSNYTVVDRPSYIFGREVLKDPYIPMPMNETGLLGNRAFAWMGRQNARISRSPIFIANYLKMFRDTAEQRAQYADVLYRKRLERAGNAAGDSPTPQALAQMRDESRQLADQMYAAQSMDSAFNLTLSYVDNPANRSNLAWKARNVARYYRATEDFYRRAQRVMKNDPLAIWKGALTYQLLGDYGFTYKNDNGDEYFAYPGNQLLLDSVTRGFALFDVDVTQYTDIAPFSIGGKVLGLTPSADPKQALPSLSGPLTAPVAALLSRFPALAGVRATVLGQYSQTTGNAYWDALQAVLPAGVNKILQSSDPEWVTSQVGSAAFDAVAVMTANGMLDEFTINGKPMKDEFGNPMSPAVVDFSQFKKTDQYTAAQAVAWSLFVLKVIGGFTAPAAPQAMSNTATDFAKRYGIDSMDDAYYDLLDKYKDDPFGREIALAEWYALKSPTRKDSEYATWDTMLPFTLSGTKFDTSSAPIASLAQVRATDELHKWFKTDEADELFTRFGDVAWFIAPKTGEFTWDSHNLITNTLGIRIRKSEAERYDELFALQGRTMEYKIKNDFDLAIAEAQSPAEVKALTAERDAVIKANREDNPPWAKQVGEMSGAKTPAKLTDVLGRTKRMLDFLEAKNGELTYDEQMIANAIDVYVDYKSRATGMQGTGAQKSAAKKMLLSQMDAELAIIRGESSNAKAFIESVLEGDPDYVFGMD